MLSLAAAATLGDQAAAQADTGLTRIAFGSCADQARPQPIWDAVLGYRPACFLFLGDNVYGDVSSGEMRELRQAYATAAAIPGYRRVRAEVPCLATWDDHDFGRNDAGADFPFKVPSKALFLDFWQVAADDPRRAREGVYHARIVGPEGRRVQFLMLDTRWFRSRLKTGDPSAGSGGGRYLPDSAAADTILRRGAVGVAHRRLRKPAELRLVISSIQVLAEGHRFERWGNFPLERQRLFDLVRDTGASGVLFLSGDRHMAAIYETTASAPYRFVELTSSGINQVWPDPTDLQGNRLGSPYAAGEFRHRRHRLGDQGRPARRAWPGWQPGAGRSPATSPTSGLRCRGR